MKDDWETMLTTTTSTRRSRRDEEGLVSAAGRVRQESRDIESWSEDLKQMPQCLEKTVVGSFFCLVCATIRAEG